MIQIPLLADKYWPAGVSQARRLWPKIECWLGSYTILRGSGPILLKNLYFCDSQGGVWTPVPPSGSAHVV